MCDPVSRRQPICLADPHAPRKNPPTDQPAAYQKRPLFAHEPQPKLASKRRQAALLHHVDPIAPNQVRQEAERYPLRPGRLAAG